MRDGISSDQGKQNHLRAHNVLHKSIFGENHSRKNQTGSFDKYKLITFVTISKNINEKITNFKRFAPLVIFMDGEKPAIFTYVQRILQFRRHFL